MAEGSGSLEHIMRREALNQAGASLREAALQAAQQGELPGIEAPAIEALRDPGVTEKVKTDALREVAKTLKAFESKEGFTGKKFSEFIKTQIDKNLSPEELTKSLREEIEQRLTQKAKEDFKAATFEEFEAQVEALQEEPPKSIEEAPKPFVEKFSDKDIESAFDVFDEGIKAAQENLDPNQAKFNPHKIPLSELDKRGFIPKTSNPELQKKYRESLKELVKSSASFDKSKKPPEKK